MYYTQTNFALNTQKIFSAGIKMIEFLKLSFKPAIGKTTDNKESVNYILNSVEKGSTIIDVGRHKRGYFFEMLKIAGHANKLIVFEPYAEVNSYLAKMTQLLRLKNVTIESQLFAERMRQTPVIDIRERISTEPKGSDAETLDNYFLSNNIEPHLLKIQADGRELELLKDSVQTLQIYKPRILIECAETKSSRQNLMTTFKWLTDLDYSGYFILDTLKIPLACFDFNIYQNEVLGFYCNNFIFE